MQHVGKRSARGVETVDPDRMGERTRHHTPTKSASGHSQIVALVDVPQRDRCSFARDRCRGIRISKGSEIILAAQPACFDRRAIYFLHAIEALDQRLNAALALLDSQFIQGGGKGC